jgi:hypothetical protein
MPDLLFEIWSDREDRSGSMGVVHPQNDRARPMVQPHATLVHSFTARSDFDAFRQNNHWHGFEPWTPPHGVDEHFFTEEEVAEQRAYLLKRTLG